MPERFQPADVGEGRVVVAAPMGVEAGLIRKGAPAFAVRRIGIGPRRASLAGRQLAELLARGGSPSRVLVVGFGGSLDRGLGMGEVVVAERLLAEGEEGVELEGAAVLAEALRAAGLPVRTASVFCARRPVVGSARERVRDQTGAVVAEMESLWFARELPVPPAVVRVISDSPGSSWLGAFAAFRGFLEARRSLRATARALQDHLLGGNHHQMQ